MSVHAIDDPSCLRRVLAAVFLIEADVDLPPLLRHVVEEACAMTGARYGALGVLDESRTELAEFITVGLDADDERRIGARPTGRGVLGLLVAVPEPLRLCDLSSHEESVGIPAGHPPMRSFLGVPITVGDTTIGNLYLTEKIGWNEFTDDDEALVTVLAVAAGIAIENARLRRLEQEHAVADDRGRMARDLHDTVIQTLYGAGLSLQAVAGAARANDVASEITAVVATIEQAIVQLRSTIFELGLSGDEIGVRARVIALLRELTVVAGFEVHSTFCGPVDSAVPAAIAEHLLATVREAVTNVGRHAQATQATVRIDVADDQCLLQVTDNGRGLGRHESSGGGSGLNNMRRRAEKLRGRFEVKSQTGGTVLTWRVPLSVG